MLSYTTHQHFVFSCIIYFYILLNISPLSDHRKMKHSSLDLSWQDESNGSSFIFLGGIDVKLDYTLAFYIIHFYILLNILPPNDHRKMKYSSLDSSWWDESNGNSFIFLSRIDIKLDYTSVFYIYTFTFRFKYLAIYCI
jgi:hypothetical protein